VLLSKADYPAELDIQLPFSLLNNNVSKDRLEVMPAYWWLYNMYALARNSWKFLNRDKRMNKVQKIEFDPLAPDTIEEIFNARRLLEIWTAKAALRQKGLSPVEGKDDELAISGHKLLTGGEELTSNLEILGEKMEYSSRKVLVLKPWKAYHAYGEMLHYYAVKNLLEYMRINTGATFVQMCKELKNERQKGWVNLGGQIMQCNDVDMLRKDIGSGTLNTWKDIHNRYDELWIKYAFDKQKHAFATLCDFSGHEDLTRADWISALDKAVNIQNFISAQVYISRKKDFDNPFRHNTYRNMEEMKSASGTVDQNSFITQVRQETEVFKNLVEEIKKRK
jgi:hypothetical protein